MLDCAGTASVMCSVVDEFVPDTACETLTMMRSPVDGLWMPLAYINGGGLCVRWFRDSFTGEPADDLSGAGSKSRHAAGWQRGIICIPHFAGRVLPNNPYVKGSFIGLDWKHTRNTYSALLWKVWHMNTTIIFLS